MTIEEYLNAIQKEYPHLMDDFDTDCPEYDTIRQAAGEKPSTIRMKLWYQVAEGDMGSRHSARQFCRLIENCTDVYLDFEEILYVGSNFAHELFVVFAAAHPDIRLTYSAPDPVANAFIERAITERRSKNEN